MSGKRYKIAYTPEARDDVDDIYSYIALTLKEQKTASKLVGRLHREIKALSSFPGSNTIVEFEPWHEKGVRRMPVGNYNVYYGVDEEKHIIAILRVLYGGRDVEHIVNVEEE